MNFDRYRTFLAAARCGTFFDAAEALYLTPATVSKHIAALERELGVVLFERHPHGVALTPAGEEKLPLVQQLVAAHDALVGTKASAPDSELTVFASPPPSRFGLEKIMQGFAATGSEFQLKIQEKRGVSAAILNQECELGFTGGSRLNPQKMQYICIQRTRLGAVLPASHPLSSRASISLSELRDDKFIFPNPEIGTLPEYMEYCRRCGFQPQIDSYGWRDDSILFYVSCGKGAGLLPREMFERFHYEQVSFVPLQESFPVNGYLARLRDHVLSPNAQIFWNYVRKYHAVK